MKWWSKLSYPKKQAWAGRIFILPWLLGFVFIFCRSLITSFIYSIGKIEVTNTGFHTNIVGLKNYKYEFFSDVNFNKTLVGSLGTLVYQVPLILIFSLVVACILNQKFRGRVLARAIFFLPVIIATGQIMSIMNGDIFSKQLTNGERSSSLFTVAGMQTMLINAGLSLKYAASLIKFVTNIFSVAYKSGIQILLFLSGLQTVPRALYEVCDIEGATPWEAFWKVTFPMISPILMLNLVYTIIDNFTDYSNPVIKMSSDLAQKMNYEQSATVAWIYFLVIIIILGVVALLTRKKVFYINE